MNRANYLNRFDDIQKELYQLTFEKNSDYAEVGDAFANFRLIGHLTNSACPPEMGILVRMSDKFCRISSLLGKQAEVKSETIMDTLNDLAVYSILLRIYLEDQINEASPHTEKTRKMSQSYSQMEVSDAQAKPLK